MATARTTQIRLGTAIVPTYPRHPLVMAQQALAIHDIAPGRLHLGIGPSHRPIIEGIYGLSLTSPLAYLREYVTVLRGVLGEGKIDYHGAFFNVTATSRTAPIPLLVSALGPKPFCLRAKSPTALFPGCVPFRICSTGRCQPCEQEPSLSSARLPRWWRTWWWR